jgi:hypothetical protein
MSSSQVSSPELTAERTALVPNLSSLSSSEFLALMNKQKASVGAPYIPGLREDWRNLVKNFWIDNRNTPCKVQVGPAGNLLFHVPAPDGMRCTFPNISSIGRPITGQNPDGTLVPATSTASTARGGKRRATRNMRNMRNTRNKRSKRRATRHRR